jgi:hypothetical protein
MSQHLTTRRQWLKQSFFFSAALATHAPGRFLRAAEGAPDDIHLFAIGDWGPEKDWKAQQAVSAAMQRHAKDLTVTPDAVLLLGDNFYGSFPG